MRRTVGLAVAGLLAAILALPAPTLAQEAEEGPQTLVVSQWKCDSQHIGEIMAGADSVALPVWEEVVDEGLLESVGTFTHEWGDSWNVNIYYVAADKEAFFDAYDEINERISERAPEDEEGPLAKYCTEHRDNIYRLGPNTGGS